MNGENNKSEAKQWIKLWLNQGVLVRNQEVEMSVIMNRHQIFEVVNDGIAGIFFSNIILYMI